MKMSSAATSSSALRALAMEYKSMQEEPVEGFRVKLINESLFEWEVAIFGPPDTLYQGGYFKVCLRRRRRTWRDLRRRHCSIISIKIHSAYNNHSSCRIAHNHRRPKICVPHKVAGQCYFNTKFNIPTCIIAASSTQIHIYLSVWLAGWRLLLPLWGHHIVVVVAPESPENKGLLRSFLFISCISIPAG